MLNRSEELDAKDIVKRAHHLCSYWTTVLSKIGIPVVKSGMVLLQNIPHHRTKYFQKREDLAARIPTFDNAFCPFSLKCEVSNTAFC